MLGFAQQRRRIACADDRRDAQLAANDGSMTGIAAMVGDDACCPFHHRHPVRIDIAGDKDRAIWEAGDVGDIADHAGLARRDGAADGRPGQERLSDSFQAIAAERRAAAARLDRLGTRLHEIEQPALALLRPFKVHRPAIMPLDNGGLAAKFQDIVILEHEAAPLGEAGLDYPGALAALWA